MTWNLYFDLVTLILILGLGLVFNRILTTLGEVIYRAWRRRMRGAGARIRSFLAVDEPVLNSIHSGFEIWFLWPILVIPILAFAVGDGMLSGVVLVAGVGWVAWLQIAREQKRKLKIENHTQQLILQLRSLLPLDHSILGSLKKTLVDLPRGELSCALTEVCSRLEMKQPPMLAYEPMEHLPGAVSRRLATLLSESMDTSEAVQMDLLAILERETEYRRSIQIKLRQNVTLVKGTIRVLQGAVVAGLAATLSLPIWREYFLADLSHRVLLLFLIAIAGAASLYFEYEVNRMMQGEGI